MEEKDYFEFMEYVGERYIRIINDKTWCGLKMNFMLRENHFTTQEIFDNWKKYHWSKKPIKRTRKT
jgi:hypothetical protein